jgi:hypothetical protein
MTTKDMRRASVDAEVDDDVHHDSYRMALVVRGLEAVLLDGFDGLLVETHAERAGDVDVLGIALSVNDD